MRKGCFGFLIICFYDYNFVTYKLYLDIFFLFYLVLFYLKGAVVISFCVIFVLNWVF